jgi:hypothetical protein
MDLLITKGTTSVKLSDYGFYNIDIDDSAPEISFDKRSVAGRNGTVFGGATFTAKVIKVTGRVAVANVQGFLSMKDDIFGLLLDDELFISPKCILTMLIFMIIKFLDKRLGIWIL